MIDRVAIKDEKGVVWSVPRPERHPHIIQIRALKGLKTGCACVQGFIDENGKFYDRDAACEHAMACGQQFYCYDPGDTSKRFEIEPPSEPFMLTSEDLW